MFITGSPLGPLIANELICSIEEQLDLNGKMPEFYRRYVNDTLTIMPGVNAASNFLQVLNACHPSISLTMEVENDGMLAFVGIQLLNKSTSINTKVFVKGYSCIETATLMPVESDSIKAKLFV